MSSSRRAKETSVQRRILKYVSLCLLVWFSLASYGSLAAAQATPSPATNCTSGQVGIGDDYYPTMGNGGYDVRHYDLDLSIDVAQGSISAATVEVDAFAVVSLCSFNLDFEGLTIDGISVDGANATFERSGKELSISPASPID